MMRTIANTRIGSMILGDTSVSPAQAAVTATAGQGSAAASSSMVEYPAIPSAEHTLRRSGPPIYEGVPTANLPTHQQINCMTCNQALRPHQRQILCYVCSSYVHHGCVEVLNIGYKYNADMCLMCQQGITRQLRVITAIELQKGRRWNPSEWFAVFLDCVDIDNGNIRQSRLE